jgi:hypothetical protein
MYAKLNNGVVEKYPYTIGDLRKDNPNVSFPAHISDDTLDSFGVVPVLQIESPQVDHTKNLSEGSPQDTSEGWVQVWVVSDASPEEITAREDSEWVEVRDKRNKLLTGSDWTQLDDTPISNSKKLEWAAYRQALRDITDQTNPFEIVWPTQPSKE